MAILNFPHAVIKNYSGQANIVTVLKPKRNSGRSPPGRAFRYRPMAIGPSLRIASLRAIRCNP